MKEFRGIPLVTPNQSLEIEFGNLSSPYKNIPEVGLAQFHCIWDRYEGDFPAFTIKNGVPYINKVSYFVEEGFYDFGIWIMNVSPKLESLKSTVQLPSSTIFLESDLELWETEYNTDLISPETPFANHLATSIKWSHVNPRVNLPDWYFVDDDINELSKHLFSFQARFKP